MSRITWSKSLRRSLYAFMLKEYGAFNFETFSTNGKPSNITTDAFRKALARWCVSEGLPAEKAQATYNQVAWACTQQPRNFVWDNGGAKNAIHNREAAIKEGWMTLDQSNYLFSLNEKK